MDSSPQGTTLGNRDGAVVRTIASHHCVPGSIPELSLGWSGLSLLLVLALGPEGFSPGFSGFSLSSKSESEGHWHRVFSRKRLLSVTLVKQIKGDLIIYFLPSHTCTDKGTGLCDAHGLVNGSQQFVKTIKCQMLHDGFGIQWS